MRRTLIRVKFQYDGILLGLMVALFYSLLFYPGCTLILRPRPIHVEALPPSPALLPPDGCAGSAYYFDAGPNFGLHTMTAPLFEVTSGEGELNDIGLYIDPDTGIIFGTPGTAGEVTFTVQASDGINSATHDFVIHIDDFAIVTPQIPSNMCSGDEYRTSIEICGGTTEQDFTWTISEGAPLAFEDSPTRTRRNWLINTGDLAAGEYAVSVSVSQGTLSDTKDYTLTVTDALTIRTAPALPAGTMGVPYPGAALTACGGTPPYTWVDPEGALPILGLRLQRDGDNYTVQGEPIAAGSFGLTLNVTDSAGALAEGHFTLAIREPITLTTTTMMTSECHDVSTLTARCFEAGGGIGDRRFQVSDPTKLPPGVTLDEEGCLSGSPLLPGTYEFDIHIADAVSELEPDIATESVTVQVIANPADNHQLDLARIRLLGTGSPDFVANEINLATEALYAKADFRITDAVWESHWNEVECTDVNRYAVLSIVGLCGEIRSTQLINICEDNPDCCDPRPPEPDDPPCDLNHHCMPCSLPNPDTPDPDDSESIHVAFFAKDDFDDLITRARAQRETVAGLGEPGDPFEFRLAIHFTCSKAGNPAWTPTPNPIATRLTRITVTGEP